MSTSSSGAPSPEPEAYVAIDKWERRRHVPATITTLRGAQDWAAEVMGPNGYSRVEVMRGGKTKEPR